MDVPNMVFLVTVVHRQESYSQGGEPDKRSVNDWIASWPPAYTNLGSRLPTDTEQLPTLATPDRVPSTPLPGQEEHRYMLATTPTGGFVDTITW